MTWQDGFAKQQTEWQQQGPPVGLTSEASSGAEVDHCKAQLEALHARARETAKEWQDKLGKMVQERLNDNDNDTTMKSNQQSSEARPFRRECRGHNPAKKSLLELVRLALLARFALAHS